jgi:hypothetical protein
MRHSTPEPRRRLVRWGVRGALVLAALAIMFGGMFNVLIAIAQGVVPPDADLAFWALLLLRSSLAWGLGAVPFGAALGAFASLIWRDGTE